MNKKGFTLIELMIVIAIIGILAAIAVPNFTKVREKAAEKAAVSTLQSLVQAMESYASMDDPGNYPEDLAALQTNTAEYFEWSDLAGNLESIGFDGDGNGGYTISGQIKGVRGVVYATVIDVGKTGTVSTSAPSGMTYTNL